jgi:hypothetical protein
MAGGFFPAVDAKKSTIRTDAPATMSGHDFLKLPEDWGMELRSLML